MPRSKFSTTARRSAAAVLLLSAAAPATAAADSLVFVKDHNVFLAAPDGSKLTAVTTDGTADSPYRSPSQSDDGTIAASKDHLIVRMRQNGEVINTIDPPELRTSASTPIDGVPVAVAISPDGSKIAYQYATYNCPIGVSCMGRSATGVTWADRFTPPTAFATTYFNHPRWVGNNRLVVGGGYLSHANLVDVNAVGVAPTHWFDDQDFFDPSSDLGQTSVSRDGSRVVSIHGYDGSTESNKRLVWFNATADPRTAALPPSNPEALCVTSVVPGLEDPVWSPSGDGLAFVTPEGMQVATSVPRDEHTCAAFSSSLVFPGASEPDWGPADVNPQPRTQPTPGGTPGGGTGGTGGTGGGAAVPTPSGGPTPAPTGGPADRPLDGSAGPIGTASLRGKASIKTATTKGLKLKLSGHRASTKVTVSVAIDSKTAQRAGLGRKAKTVGKRTVKTTTAGSATTTVRFDRAAAKRLRRLSTFTVTIKVDGDTVTTLTLKK